MIRTVTDLINELGNIRDRFTSSSIPVSVDGKEIYSVELVDEYKEMYKDERAHSFLMLDILDKALESADLAEDMLRIFNNVDKMYKRYGDNN